MENLAQPTFPVSGRGRSPCPNRPAVAGRGPASGDAGDADAIEDRRQRLLGMVVGAGSTARLPPSCVPLEQFVGMQSLPLLETCPRGVGCSPRWFMCL